MTRRLEQATEDALIASPSFSSDLKAQLLARLSSADITTRLQHSRPLVSASASVCLDAAESPWLGTESTEAAVRRMLEDKYPREKRVMDLRPQRVVRRSVGERVDEARERARGYQDEGHQGEKNGFREELRDRFGGEGRVGGVAVSAVASLANQRYVVRSRVLN